MMKIIMTCPDCAGNGWLNEEENCLLCKATGELTIEPTPGPWRIFEVSPKGKPSMHFRAPEGHMGIYSDGAAHVFEICSPAEYMDRIFGSGRGGHIATIPIAYGPAGRAQALVNAQFIIRARSDAHEENARLRDALREIAEMQILSHTAQDNVMREIAINALD